jgi:hypothetical protein
MFSISHSLSKRVAVLSTSDFAVSLPDIHVSATTVRTQSFHVTMVVETLEQQLTLGHKMKAPLPLSPLSLHIRTFCDRNRRTGNTPNIAPHLTKLSITFLTISSEVVPFEAE